MSLSKTDRIKCCFFCIRGFESPYRSTADLLENLTARASEVIADMYKIDLIHDSHAKACEKTYYKVTEVDIIGIRFAFHKNVDVSQHNFNVIIDFKPKDEKPT